MERVLLVQGGEGEFRITVPANAKITFGPFSPPNTKTGYSNHSAKAEGTLRVYVGSKDNIVFCQSGVTGFRDTSLDYSKKIVTEEVSSVWKSDSGGYSRETVGKRNVDWIDEDVDSLPMLAAPPSRRKK